MNERQRVENIRYNGYTTEPSDYDSPDGDLATCIGLVNEDGALKPVLPPKNCNTPRLYVSVDVYYKLTVCFVHKNQDWLHYIGYAYDKQTKNLFLGWLDFDSDDGWENTSDDQWDCFYTYKSDSRRSVFVITGETFNSITAIGNMLIVSTDKHIHYFLYNQYEFDNGHSWFDYKYLGTSVPSVEMEFALDGELYAQSFMDTGLTASKDKSTNENSDTWKVIFTENVSWNYTDDQEYRVTFPSGTVLKKDTQYCFTFKNIIKRGGSRFYRLWGVKADGTKELIGCPTFQTFHSSSCIFTMKSEYVGIIADSYKGDVGRVANNVYRIEEGNTSIASDKEIVNYTEDNFTALMGIMNLFVNKHATENERFIYPFFVRYATKLYTGDYVNVSPPILMRPNTGYVPLVEWNNDSEKLTATAYAFVASLAARGETEITSDWEDLIQGVDIFVSQPLYCYDQGASYDASETKFSYFTLGEDGKTNNWQDLIGSAYDSTSYMRANFAGADINNDIYGKLTLGEGLQRADVNTSTSMKMLIRIAEKEIDVDDLLSLSSFYKIASLDLAEFNDLVGERELNADNQLTGGFKLLSIEKGNLKNLTTRETLPDEPLANRSFVKGDIFTYNKRLHVYGGAYALPAPTSIQQQNGMFTGTAASDGYLYEERELYVRLHTSDGDKMAYTQIPTQSFVRSLSDCPWFFYPDNRATDLYIRATRRTGSTSQTGFIKLPLTAHPLLNGVYWYAGGLIGQDGFDAVSDPELTVDASVNVGTQTNIYVSEVNNPFAFKSENVVSIDATRIIGLCTAAKAMSTGQFGQFPLYVFTDNGVWAMELTSTGVYKATQPITRDVCVNAASITQMDGEVLFATARGIMLLAGSASTCLSDTLNAEKQFVLTDIMTEKQAQTLLDYVNTGDGTMLELKKIEVTSFLDYIKGCRCVYDYVRQRIVVYNPAYSYAYVYSIKGKSWGMMQSGLASTVNSYPDALAMDTDGNLVDLSLSDAKGTNGLVMTRPLKLGFPDGYKTVDTILQRGYFKTGHVQQVLYASNDLFSWKGVWSSADERLRGFAGTPYKYFRLALICKLDAEESVSGLTVRYEPRLTNRPR